MEGRPGQYRARGSWPLIVKLKVKSFTPRILKANIDSQTYQKFINFHLIKDRLPLAMAAKIELIIDTIETIILIAMKNKSTNKSRIRALKIF